jgi:7-carboxy-7-deazaguanine synthase
MKLSEIYTSIQGEGPNTGKLIQFVRFGGCNMRCPGWPCDTQFAIDPIYRDEWESVQPHEILQRMPPFPRHVCLTGGEPLIQPSKQLEQFVKGFPQGSWRFDLFTNGSQGLPGWAFDQDVTVVMDWKLEGSGERTTGLDTRKANARILWSKDAIKFVVCNEDDLDEAREVTDWAYKMGVRASLWVGAAWGHMEPPELMEYILKYRLPWKVNVQVHKYIWGDIRGV